MNYIYWKYLFLLCSFIFIIFQVISTYQIIYSNCNCYKSYLWIFCISTGCVIPVNLIITQSSFLKINDFFLSILITLTFLLFNLSLVIWGISELFIKCISLKLCYIWIYGIINCSILLLFIIVFIIFGWKDYKVFILFNQGFSNNFIENMS